MAKNEQQLLSTREAQKYLAEKHNLQREMPTFHRWAQSGELPADSYQGRGRRYDPRSLDIQAARLTTRSNDKLEAGIPVPADQHTKTRNEKMSKDTSKSFNTRRTSAEASETRRAVPFGKGGKNRDVHTQNADTAAPGITGHKTSAKGAGKQFLEGGNAVPGKRSAQGVAAPARSGRTGNVTGEAANSARGPRRDRSRDYSKEGPIR
jgi:hypothetical protein